MSALNRISSARRLVTASSALSIRATRPTPSEPKLFVLEGEHEFQAGVGSTAFGVTAVVKADGVGRFAKIGATIANDVRQDARITTKRQTGAIDQRDRAQ